MFKCTGIKRKIVATMTNIDVKANRETRNQQAVRHMAVVYASNLLGVLGPDKFIDYFLVTKTASEYFLP
jgi:hypothetical protein